MVNFEVMKRANELLIKNPAPEDGCNSDIDSVAQSSTLLHLRELLDSEYTKIEYWLNKNNTESIRLKAIISLMKDYGLRVSEVLNIKASDIHPGPMIVIHGSKGSNNRVISVVRYRSIWSKNKISMAAYIRGLSRFYLYRVCKKYGFYFNQEGNGNAKVTHYFRYLYMMNLQLAGIDENDTKRAIGHKNINSQKWYYDKTLKKV